jgi:DNA-binding transcriptional ArsR family regulator
VSRHGALPLPLLGHIAGQFRALGEPLRLRLVSCLFDGPATVGELAQRVDSSVANVSKHLAILHQAGWITRQKDGVAVRCSLADERAVALCELMCSRVRERAAAEADLAALGPRRRRS